jgi:hypothetical protein
VLPHADRKVAVPDDEGRHAIGDAQLDAGVELPGDPLDPVPHRAMLRGMPSR